jgi:hypothetical protein
MFEALKRARRLAHESTTSAKAISALNYLRRLPLPRRSKIGTLLHGTAFRTTNPTRRFARRSSNMARALGPHGDRRGVETLGGNASSCSSTRDARAGLSLRAAAHGRARSAAFFAHRGGGGDRHETTRRQAADDSAQLEPRDRRVRSRRSSAKVLPEFGASGPRFAIEDADGRTRCTAALLEAALRVFSWVECEGEVRGAAAGVAPTARERGPGEHLRAAQDVLPARAPRELGAGHALNRAVVWIPRASSASRAAKPRRRSENMITAAPVRCTKKLDSTDPTARLGDTGP